MFIHNDIFAWDGWGGTIRLAAGKCHLWLFDLRRVSPSPADMIFIKSIVGVVKEIDPDNPVSLRSVTSHIATRVVRRFKIDPRRLLWVEYIPGRTYGPDNSLTVPGRLDAVDLTWMAGNALTPKWRPLEEPLRSLIIRIIDPRGDGLLSR